jgi:hypothetical protein
MRITKVDGAPLKSTVERAMHNHDEDFEAEGDNFDDEDEDFDDEGGDFEDEDYPIDGVGFADPGGRSALRRATPNNPRDQPCPTCKQPNKLTPLDVRAGYQCDGCADRDEGLFG